jgi:hypothetical protein
MPRRFLMMSKRELIKFWPKGISEEGVSVGVGISGVGVGVGLTPKSGVGVGSVA